MNPVHFDEEYARKTIFRGRVAHGALSIGFISAVLGTKLPGAGTIFVSATIVFKPPVRIGDTVITTCTVREVERPRRDHGLRLQGRRASWCWKPRRWCWRPSGPPRQGLG